LGGDVRLNERASDTMLRCASSSVRLIADAQQRRKMQ
jgi:hypothetical protein